MEDQYRVFEQRCLPLYRHLISVTLIAWGAFIAHEGMSQVVATPPVAPVKVVTDEYFNIKVADPYRYMEDLSNPDVKEWFKDQDTYTRSVISRIPGRAALLARLEQLDQSGPPRVFDVQRYQGDRFFYQKRLPDEEVSKLYERTGLQGAEKLIVDPERYADKAGVHYTLNYYAPSFDGHYVAYGVSPSGTEDAVIHVQELSTGKETGESIDRSWYGEFSGSPMGAPSCTSVCRSLLRMRNLRSEG